MQKAVSLLSLLLLASCASSLNRGKSEFFEGMYDLRYDPGHAKVHFERSETYMAEALAEGDLETREKVTALSVRLRSLIELDRHPEAAALLGAPIEGFDPNYRYEGDTTGLALIAARHTDHDRAYRDLILAEKHARTARARQALAWEQVRVLRAKGTPQAKAEAVKICERNAGKLDFDEQRKALTQ